jgi:hypothetical protein
MNHSESLGKSTLRSQTGTRRKKQATGRGLTGSESEHFDDNHAGIG